MSNQDTWARNQKPVATAAPSTRASQESHDVRVNDRQDYPRTSGRGRDDRFHSHPQGKSFDSHSKKFASRRCGLFGFNSSSRRHFPLILKQVDVTATLYDFAAKIVLVQTYVNNEEHPIEATYTFPAAANGAVCGFKATIDGRTVEGHVTDSEAALDSYDDGIASGQGAYLLSPDPDRPAAFTVLVGNLPPGQEASITVTYVAEMRLLTGKGKNRQGGLWLDKVYLDVTNPRLSFSLPSFVAPRSKKKRNQLQPQRVFPKYKLTVNVDIHSSFPLQGVSCVQPISTHFTDPKHIKVALGSHIHSLKHDFALNVTLPENAAERSYALLEKPSAEGDAYAAMFMIYPRELQANIVPVAVPETQEKKPEGDKEQTETAGTPKEGAATAGSERTKKPNPLSITNLSWNWGNIQGIQTSALQASVKYSRNMIIGYCLIPSTVIEGSEPVKVAVKGTAPKGDFSLDITVNTQSPLEGDVVHKLFARSKLRELEAKAPETKQDIIELGKKYSLASRYTSFVGIEERTEPTEGTMVKRTIPLATLSTDQRQHVSNRGRGAPRGRGGRDSHEGRGGYGGRGRGGDRGDRGERGSRDSWNNNTDYGHHSDRGQPQYYAHDNRRADHESRYDSGRDRDSHYVEPMARRGPSNQSERGGQRSGLRFSAGTIQKLIDLKGQKYDYWIVSKGLAEIFNVTINDLLASLNADHQGSVVVRNIWATALVVSAINSLPGDLRDHHSAVSKAAQEWLDEELRKEADIGNREAWLKRAYNFLASL